MPPVETAFLALWNDVDPARTAEYDAWHTFEHVPERVGIPGFVAARRYVAAERTTHRYFTRYDLTDIAALDGAAYADVVAQPTPWSRSMRASLSNFVRLPCIRRARGGRGVGGAVLTIQLDARSGDTAIEALTRELLEAVQEGPIVAVDVGAVSASAPFPWPNAGADAGRGNTAATITHVLLIDALDRAMLDSATSALLAVVDARGGEVVAHAAYDLVLTVAPDESAGETPARAAPREDLRRKWQPS